MRIENKCICVALHWTAVTDREKQSTLQRHLWPWIAWPANMQFMLGSWGLYTHWWWGLGTQFSWHQNMHLLKGLLKPTLQTRFECFSILHYVSTGHLSLKSSLPFKLNPMLLGHIDYLLLLFSFVCFVLLFLVLFVFKKRKGKQEGTDKALGWDGYLLHVRVSDTVSFLDIFSSYSLQKVYVYKKNRSYNLNERSLRSCFFWFSWGEYFKILPLIPWSVCLGLFSFRDNSNQPFLEIQKELGHCRRLFLLKLQDNTKRVTVLTGTSFMSKHLGKLLPLANWGICK